MTETSARVLYIDDDPGLGAQRALLDSIPGLGHKTIPTLLAVKSP